MTNIKFLTWNVRGLRDRIKRSAIFECLKTYRADISVLVETHITGQIQRALRRPWIGWTYHATHTPYSRGVSILIAKSTPFSCISVRTDPQGRFIFLHCTLSGIQYLIMAFYIPPPYTSTLINEGLLFMAKHPLVPSIWLGDFNMVLDPSMERLQLSRDAPHPNTTRFGRTLTEFSLADT